MRLLKNEDGPTATEYAVMLALLVLVATVAMTALGNKVSQSFTTLAASLG